MLTLIPTSKLRMAQDNERWAKEFTPKALADLAASISDLGILQPLLVRELPADTNGEAFEVIAGHRRWKAAELAKIEEVPCQVIAPKDQDKVDASRLAENLHRQNIDPVLEGRAYNKLLARHSLKEVCALVRKSHNHVLRRSLLADADRDVLKLLERGVITLGAAEFVAKLDKDLQKEAAAHLADRAYADGDAWATKAAIDSVVWSVMLHLNAAPFDPKDAELHPPAGACTTCSKLVGNAPKLFEEIDGREKNRCSDASCFKTKTNLFLTREVKKWIDDGAEPIPEENMAKMFPHGYLDGRYKKWATFDAPCPHTSGNTWAQALGKKYRPQLYVGVTPDFRVKVLFKIAEAMKVARENGAKWIPKRTRRDPKEVFKTRVEAMIPRVRHIETAQTLAGVFDVKPVGIGADPKVVRELAKFIIDATTSDQTKEMARRRHIEPKVTKERYRGEVADYGSPLIDYVADRGLGEVIAVMFENTLSHWSADVEQLAKKLGIRGTTLRKLATERVKFEDAERERIKTEKAAAAAAKKGKKKTKRAKRKTKAAQA